MSKTTLTIEMLQHLNTGRVFKVSELAELLNANPRNIVEYRKELQKDGYEIITISGKFGGYQLNKTVLIPSLKMMPKEKEALLQAYDYVLSKKDFLRKEELTEAMSKITSSIQTQAKTEGYTVGDHYQLTMSEEDIRERYLFIDEAIKTKHAIRIEYQSVTEENTKTHILNPYDLIIYNNSWFFTAWEMEAGDVRYFKINRIIKFEMLSETFVVWKSYRLEDYFDADGFKKNGPMIHVVLYAKGVRKVLFQERVYGKNQNVTPLNDETVLVSFDAPDNGQLLSMLLGCGPEIEIQEPQELIEKVKEKIHEMSLLYQK